MNRPASCVGVEDGAMVVLEQVHGMGLTAAGELGSSTPCEEMDDN